MKAIRSWPIWGLPGVVIAPVLLVELTALALVVMQYLTHPVNPLQYWEFGALCLLGIAHTEIANGVERMRRRVTDSIHVELSSVWTFAAALVLPGALAALVAVIVLTHLWWRAWRPRVPLYKQSFNTATVVLACLAASAVSRQFWSGNADDWRALVAIVLGLLVYTTVNSGLVAGAIAVSMDRPTPAQLLGHWDENMLELSTLCLGGLTALVLGVNPWLVVLVLPPLLVLHRAVLVRQLEEAANTDSKTGLLNARAWQNSASRELRRALRTDRSAAVLVIDLDHFKNVNDTHGHLVGDQVLAAVASVLSAEVRANDVVGRFGGEEFVVLLSGLDGNGKDRSELQAIAERIRRRVEALQVEVPTPDGPLTISGLSVSVGCATFPDDGGDLQRLLEVADSALYAAKRSGRNAVKMGLHLHAADGRTIGESGSQALG